MPTDSVEPVSAYTCSPTATTASCEPERREPLPPPQPAELGADPQRGGVGEQAGHDRRGYVPVGRTSRRALASSAAGPTGTAPDDGPVSAGGATSGGAGPVGRAAGRRRERRTGRGAGAARDVPPPVGATGYRSIGRVGVPPRAELTADRRFSVTRPLIAAPSERAKSAAFDSSSVTRACTWRVLPRAPGPALDRLEPLPSGTGAQHVAQTRAHDECRLGPHASPPSCRTAGLPRGSRG